MPIKVVTPPVIEPVTLAEAKLHARVDADDVLEDTLLSILISSARSHGENTTRRAFVTQTLELTLPSFPANGDPIELPRPPFQSITSVTYIDATGASVTLDPAAYFALATSDSVPALLYPAPDDCWPATAVRPNAVAIRYVAGWPVTTGSPPLATTPEALRAWMLVRITDLYTQREKYVVGTGRDSLITLDRDFVDGLLDAYTILEA